MKDGPDISRIAALIGDPARSNMLLALMDGRALTASELADAAGITKQTASFHLARLLDGALLAREIQGRHHYFRLDNADVGHAIEVLLGIAESRTGNRARTGPKEPALRKARICYDHLAGELGVLVYDRMCAQRWLTGAGNETFVTPKGWVALKRIGVTKSDLSNSRRPQCKTCLDWSMRRHHLAGVVGQKLLEQFFERGWAKQLPQTRIIEFSKKGEASLRKWLN